MKLVDMTKIIRSKNAGPFHLTLDILFDSREYFEKAKASGVLNADLISKLYQVPLEKVEFYEFDAACAFKATLPRRIASGSPGDNDIYGSQQHALLMNIEIPD